MKGAVRTVRAALALSVKDWRPASDMVIVMVCLGEMVRVFVVNVYKDVQEEDLCVRGRGGFGFIGLKLAGFIRLVDG